MNETLTKSQRVVRVVCTVALFILAVFWLIPVFWCILNSLKTNVEFLNSYSNFTTRWEYLKAVFPEKFNLQSYISLFTGEGLSTVARLDTMILNSLVVSVVVTAVVVFVTSLSAFAYERLEFPVGEKIFWTIFYISLIPTSASTLPLFKICHAFGWINNLNSLIWPMCCGIMNVFLIRNFLKGIPKDLDEAARIDGAGSFGIYTRIIVPSMKPVLMIVGLGAFRGAWNDYYWPTIVMTDPNNQTLTSGLAQMMNQFGNNQWTNLLAGAVLSMLVPLGLYLTCQEYFLQGINIQAAVKG